MATTDTIKRIRFEPIAGPPTEPIVVLSSKPWVIGRQSTADSVLNDNSVSRRHALVTHKADTWLLSDLESRHGTFVNGIKLGQGDSSPIHDGDLVRIGPWTYRVGGPTHGTRVSASDDVDSTVNRVRHVPQHELSLRAQHRLDLLIDCAASITAASSEKQLASAVLDALLAGTGFPRAAFIRRVGDMGPGGSPQIEVIEVRGPESAAGHLTDSQAAVIAAQLRPEQGLTFSRSLIQAAAEGQVARLDEQGVQDFGQSVVQLGIQAAICAPVMLDSAPAAYLYLDTRRPDPRTGQPRPGGASSAGIQPDAAAFCQAVARICGLAMANLNRLDLSRRQRQLEDDLDAAREAQKLIMPKPDGKIGPFEYSIKSKPGRFVAGDLIDIIGLPGGRIAVFLGDVSGKGIGAAMLMATAQAHLNASLRQNPDPAEAISDVNKHVTSHMQDGRFISLWIGVLDPGRRQLTFVDAGHGHWLVKPAGKPAERVHASGGLPVGVDKDAHYVNEKLAFEPSSRLVLYSDGLVEQRSPMGDEFGVDRTIEALAGTKSAAEDVEALFDTLIGFAAGTQPGARKPSPDHVSLTDDLTVSSIAFVD